VDWHNIKVWRKRGAVGLRWHIKKEKLNNKQAYAYIPTTCNRETFCGVVLGAAWIRGAVANNKDMSATS